MIGVVDYGMGNRRSVVKALEHVGGDPVLTSDEATLERADGLVVPGVGAFPEAMRRLRATGLDALVRERADAGAPVIGLCLGMQLLFERSSEWEGAEGIGLLGGAVERLEPGPDLKLPHIGWNRVTWRRESPLLDGLPAGAAFYHVHSFVPVPDDDDVVLGEGEYGVRFASFVERGTVFGAQSHPEKSSVHGLRVLGNFVKLARRASADAALPGR